LPLAIITSASWLGSACSRPMSSLTVIAISPDDRPCKPVERNRRLDLHVIEKGPSFTKSNVRMQAWLVNFRDVSRSCRPPKPSASFRLSRKLQPILGKAQPSLLIQRVHGLLR
jgi:hypothetical protein